MVSLEVAQGLRAALALRTPPGPSLQSQAYLWSKAERQSGRQGPYGKSAFIKIIASFNVSLRKGLPPPPPPVIGFDHKQLEAPGQSRISGKQPDF